MTPYEIQEAGRIAYDKATTRAERLEVVRNTKEAYELAVSKGWGTFSPEGRGSRSDSGASSSAPYRRRTR